MTSPPLISFIASLAVPRRARSLVFWSMDLNPDEAIVAGWLREKSLVARLLSLMMLHSLRRADRIVALDRFMKVRIEAKGIPAEKVLLVPPWSHDDRVRFDAAGREEFRAIHELSDRFVVMYSGTTAHATLWRRSFRPLSGLSIMKISRFALLAGEASSERCRSVRESAACRTCCVFFTNR